MKTKSRKYKPLKTTSCHVINLNTNLIITFLSYFKMAFVNSKKKSLMCESFDLKPRQNV